MTSTEIRLIERVIMDYLRVDDEQVRKQARTWTMDEILRQEG